MGETSHFFTSVDKQEVLAFAEQLRNNFNDNDEELFNELKHIFDAVLEEIDLLKDTVCYIMITFKKEKDFNKNILQEGLEYLYQQEHIAPSELIITNETIDEIIITCSVRGSISTIDEFMDILDDIFNVDTRMNIFAKVGENIFIPNEQYKQFMEVYRDIPVF